MHFEILVEDQSGKKMLDEILPRIIGAAHTFRVLPYKGIGKIPKGMKPGSDASKRILLDQLPRLLQGHGKTFAGYGPNYHAAVVVVCDLDRKCFHDFRQELLGVLTAIHPRPEARFCLAIEEGEAWLLGDRDAIRAAYPNAKLAVLDDYTQDSICGTWEVLADAIHPGGSGALIVAGWQASGAAKSAWATTISPRMNVEGNDSPSFRYFRSKMRELAGQNLMVAERQNAVGLLQKAPAIHRKRTT